MDIGMNAMQPMTALYQNGWPLGTSDFCGKKLW